MNVHRIAGSSCSPLLASIRRYATQRFITQGPPLLVKDAFTQGRDYLLAMKPQRVDSSIQHTTETFATRVVLSHVLGIGSRLTLSKKEENTSLNEGQLYATLIERVGKGEPLQYVIGEWSFGDIDLMVSKDVLIPRPDSEVIIAAMENVHHDKGRPLTIVDIGIGSGCLLLSLLKKYPNSRGIGIDISPKAVEVTRTNATSLGLINRASLFCASMESLLEQLKQSSGANPVSLLPPDILKAISNADVLISNPPYIKTSDIPQLQPEVRDYEPFIALDGGEDGLKFYRILGSIFAIISGNNTQSHAFFEIGYGQKDDLKAILESNGTAMLRAHKDHSDIDRCVVAHRLHV